MVKRAKFLKPRSVEKLSDYIQEHNIKRKDIISINSHYDRGNTDWGVKLTELFYFTNDNQTNFSS
jgi:hypothetical protein